jgi:hypothetical protein
VYGYDPFEFEDKRIWTCGRISCPYNQGARETMIAHFKFCKGTTDERKIKIKEDVLKKLQACKLPITDTGKFVVHAGIPNVEKNFWIEFLLSNNYDVVVLDDDELRPPSVAEMKQT